MKNGWYDYQKTRKEMIEFDGETIKKDKKKSLMRCLYIYKKKRNKEYETSNSKTINK